MQRSESTARLDFRTYSAFATSCLHFGHLLWISFLLFAAGDDDDLRLSMPRFLMRLPVSAWKLVAARMSYGLASTAALALLSTITYYGLFEGRMVQALPFRALLMIYPVLYAMLQSAVWCIGPAGIAPTIAVIAFGSLIPNGIFFRFGFSPFDSNNYSLPGIGAAITISFLAAGVAVEQHRKRRFAFMESFSALVSRRRSGRAHEATRFASKEAALRWYEHRRQWRLFAPILFTLFFAALAGRALLYSWMSPQTFAKMPGYYVRAYYANWVQYGVYTGLTVASLLTSGLFFFRSGRPLYTKDRMFLFSRPVTVETLAAARWEAGAKSIGFALLPLFVIEVIACSMDVRWGGYDPSTGETKWDTMPALLAENYPIYLIVLMTIAALASIYGAVWAVLWFENVLAIGLVFAAVAFTVENVPAFQETDRIVRSNYELRITSAIILVVLLPAAIAAVRKHLVSTKHLYALFGLAPIFGIGMFLVLNADSIVAERPIDFSVWSTIVPLYLMAVIAPLVTTPLITQRARHRP
jgi:hypothetical protein